MALSDIYGLRRLRSRITSTCLDAEKLTVKKLKYLTNSDNETIRLGYRLGSLLVDGDVIALMGGLGSGKTWFTKGIGLGLGLERNTVITSPSFAIVNEYQGRRILYHMDLYRLHSLSDFFSTGLEEYFYIDGVVVIEWADRWPEVLPARRIEVRFAIIDERRRNITMKGCHLRAINILDSIAKEAL